MLRREMSCNCHMLGNMTVVYSFDALGLDPSAQLQAAMGPRVEHENVMFLFVH